MSIEAFVWNYRDGEPAPLPCDAIRRIFDTSGAAWIDKLQHLHVQFTDPDESVDIYFADDAHEADVTHGMTISRPIDHPDYLARMFEVLQLDNVMLFYSDDTTPIFHVASDPSEYPSDLLAKLGAPRFAGSPDDLLHEPLQRRLRKRQS